MRSHTIEPYEDKKVPKLKSFVSNLMRGIRRTKLQLPEMTAEDQRAISFDFANKYDSKHFQNLLRRNMAEMKESMDLADGEIAQG